MTRSPRQNDGTDCPVCGEVTHQDVRDVTGRVVHYAYIPLWHQRMTMRALHVEHCAGVDAKAERLPKNWAIV